jgi:outer membrane PBP1 activator LpoA protein
MMAELKQEISDILAARRTAEPDETKAGPGGANADTSPGGAPDAYILRLPLLTPSGQASEAGSGSSWQAAEALVRSGQTDKGLAEMMRLAAHETTGRSRFQRKLLLAEVCLQTKRNRLARSILEELAENIDHFHLENWESSELISDVWTRLYRMYASSDNSDDNDRAAKLYERLCRLDPWQALRCAEV